MLANYLMQKTNYFSPSFKFVNTKCFQTSFVNEKFHRLEFLYSSSTSCYVYYRS